MISSLPTSNLPNIPFPISKRTVEKMRTFGSGLGDLSGQVMEDVYVVVAVFREGVPNYERIFHTRDLAINDATGWINASGKGIQLVGVAVMRNGFIVSGHVLYRKVEE